jgi:hypothetical protein
VEREVTEFHKLSQKEVLFAGRERVYRPTDEVNGQKLPAESQRVQQRADDLLKKAVSRWTEVWNLVLTQDSGNQLAKADIVVDGQTVMSAVPVTSLLYFDKQLNDLETFVSKLPTPDPAEEWNHDTNSGLLKGKSTESVRTSKEPTVIVKHAPTKEHPAQTEIYVKDVPVGTWTQILYSGAMPSDRKETILAKVRKLQVAVKEAREQANLTETTKRDVKPLLEFAFGKEIYS